MIEIQPSALSRIDIAQSPEYIPLIEPHLIPFLLKPVSLGLWVPIEARFEGKLIGLTLTEVYHDLLRDNAQLYSFIVDPNWRRKGIGRQLFSFTQNWLVQEKKIRSFEFFYVEEDPCAIAVEKILASQGWLPARTQVIKLYFDVISFNPRWLHYFSPLPESMQIFSWSELLPEDREHIEYLGSQRRFVPYLNPLRDEELILKEASVGLRQNGQIVGWSITKRVDASTICYAILYVDSELLYQSYGIRLLVESIRCQKNLQIPNALFEVNLRAIDKSWGRFIKKRLMPLAYKIEHVKHPIFIV